jgi:hypothetical protein
MEEDDCNLIESHRIFRSLDDFSANPSSSHGSLFSTEDNIRPALVPSRPRNRRQINSHMPLAKAKSTPMHLNQIFEERESDLDDSPMNSPRVERSRKHTGGGAIKPRRTPRRLSPVTSSGSRRSSSCSSSDDDDLDKHMKRLNTSSSCRRSPRQYRRDDSGSEGDGGLDGGLDGGGSRHKGIGPLDHTSSTQRRNEDSSSKGNTQKQNGGGKTNSMNRNNFLLHSGDSKCTLDSIDESNKENMFGDQAAGSGSTYISYSTNMLLKENTTFVSNMELPCNTTPQDNCLQTEHDCEKANSATLPQKTDVEHKNMSYSIVAERKGSAVKYIHSFTELERTLESNGDHLCNGGGKRDSLTPTDLENIDMKVDIKRQKTLNSESSHLQVLRAPTVRSVTSACCQIF